jgi:hypothetical protein
MEFHFKQDFVSQILYGDLPNILTFKDILSYTFFIIINKLKNQIY